VLLWPCTFIPPLWYTFCTSCVGRATCCECPGDRSEYNPIGRQVLRYLYLLLRFPWSFLTFLVLFLGNTLCARRCHSTCGEACCHNPTQIAYIHSLYVIRQTLLKGWRRFLCCCISEGAGVLAVLWELDTPPRYIFDEDADTPALLTFQEYLARVETGKVPVPPYSGKYRAIDGGGNQRIFPWIGQGGRGYAMNEPFQALHNLPSADEVVRLLYKRDAFKKAPYGVNSLATWFANVAIHDFFRTATGTDGGTHPERGSDKEWVNLHSSYLDLQPLYGYSKTTADATREWSGGKLKAFAEDRMRRIPESRVIVELLRREHNYVAEQLAQRYPAQFAADEELYQQARLIMGGVYINIILRAYGCQMFGEIAPDGSGFCELRQGYGGAGVGNMCTFNFNLIYRFHTSIPVEWSATDPPPIDTDEQMRTLLNGILNWESGGFGPNNVPDSILGERARVSQRAIEAARLMGAPTLNTFRRRFTSGYSSFEDMTGGDQATADTLRQLYPGGIEDVELVVGCQVEKCMSGGWALPSTIGQAIVADAFASIRQDRFYTQDWGASSYTAWGFEHAKSTVLADVINRHLGTNSFSVNRLVGLEKLPDWAGPPEWSQVVSFNERGFPILKEDSPGGV